jgi:hypothetical protein
VRIFGDRETTADRPVTTDRAETPAEAADREAREAEHVERVETRERDVVAERPGHPIAAARDRFGGIDLPASLVGMLTALAMLVLLGGLVGAAIGVVGYQTGLGGDNVEDISLASLIGGLVVLALSYLVGGWAAGRIARYDGARNGLMTGVWTLILAAALAALGAWAGDEYNVLANVDLPNWFNEDTLTTAAAISGIVAIGTMLLAGLLGGLWGTRYHRIADESLLDAHEYRDVRVD